MRANDIQEGGDHYRQKGGDIPQHWDLSIMYSWDAFQYQITKYVMRWKDKGDTFEKRLLDLKKARHFLDKYIENAEHYDQEHRALKTMATEVIVHQRTKSEVDAEWAAQEIAASQFFKDGFTAEGNWYQCSKCKVRVLAGSPLNAQRLHVGQCLGHQPSVAPDHSYAPPEGFVAYAGQAPTNGAQS